MNLFFITVPIFYLIFIPFFFLEPVPDLVWTGSTTLIFIVQSGFSEFCRRAPPLIIPALTFSLVINCVSWLIEGPILRLVDWLMGGYFIWLLTDGLILRLVHWLMGRYFDWLIDWWADISIGWLIDGPIFRLVDWLMGRYFDWFIYWWADTLDVWLIDGPILQLVDWLMGRC